MKQKIDTHLDVNIKMGMNFFYRNIYI